MPPRRSTILFNPLICAAAALSEPIKAYRVLIARIRHPALYLSLVTHLDVDKQGNSNDKAIRDGFAIILAF